MRRVLLNDTVNNSEAYIALVMSEMGVWSRGRMTLMWEHVGTQWRGEGGLAPLPLRPP